MKIKESLLYCAHILQIAKHLLAEGGTLLQTINCYSSYNIHVIISIIILEI
jgi:hypothetical protein